MHDAGGGNELVCRITLKIETSGGACNREIKRPYLYAVQNPAYVTVVKVHVYPTEVNQLGQFP